MIEVSSFPLASALKRHRVLRVPIVRGVVALAGSLMIGLRALEVSANAQLSTGDASPRAGTDGERAGADPARTGAARGAEEISGGVWAGTVVLSLAFAVVLFFLIPVGLTSLIKDQLGSSVLFWLVEGLVRTAIFLGYMILLSRLAQPQARF